MDNTILLASLSQDLNTLNKLNKAMIQKINSSNVISWLYPTKPWLEIDYSLLNNKDNDNYIIYLEFIIDRLYVTLTLINNYLEEIVDMAPTKLFKSITKPRTVTLGLSANMLWDKIQKLNHIMRNKELYKIESMGNPNNMLVSCNLNGTVNKKLQTELCSTHKCISCTIAMNAIKMMEQEIIAIGKSKYVIETRNRIKESLFDISQSACMEKLSTAVLENIRHIKEQFKEAELKLKYMNELLEDVKCKYQCSLRRLESGENTVRNLETLLLREKEKQHGMSQLINTLFSDKYKTENCINSKDEIIENLQNKIKEEEAIIYDLQHEIDVQKQISLDSTNKEELIMAEKELWKIRYTHSHEENVKIKSTNDELKEQVRNLEEKIVVMTNSFTEADNKTPIVNKEICNHSITCKTSLNAQDVVCSKLIPDDKLKNNINRCTNNAVFSANDIEVQGNPLIDMTKQVELNKITIKKLEMQNTVLAKTIEKFHAISSEKKFVNKNIP